MTRRRTTTTKEERERELLRSDDTPIQLRRFYSVIRLYRELARMMHATERTHLPVEERQKMWMETFKFLDDDDFTNALEELKQVQKLNTELGKEMERVIQPLIDKEIAQRKEDMR
jgi:hypothetical protein